MLLTVFLVGIFLGGCALGLAYQLGPWQFAGRMRALDPELDTIPSVLPDTSVSTLPGERLEKFGVSFQLPWQHSDDVRLRNNTLVANGEGAIIFFEDPSYDHSTASMIRDFGKAIPGLNHEDRGSICGLQRVAMYAKTTDVKWWKIPSQNKRARELLILKVLTEPPMPSGTRYVIDMNGFCGFQRGSPAAAPYQVWVELFDSAGRHYRITVSSHGTPRFKQADINAIVSSIRSDLPR
jgi:hypothetical protein